MSSSSRSGLQLVRNNVDQPTCFCGLPGHERVSWKFGNPGRRFWNCPKSLTTHVSCKYFEWKDPELHDDYYKGLLRSLKAQLETKEDLSQISNYRKKVHELEVMRSKEKISYEKDVMELMQENAGLKNKVGYTKSFSLMLLVAICAAVVKEYQRSGIVVRFLV